MHLRRSLALALLLMCHTVRSLAEERYASPEEVALSPSGKQLLITCSGSNELVVVDLRTRSIVSRIAVGSHPRGLVLDPNSNHVYVANSWSDSVSEVDIATATVTRTFPVGMEPVGLVLHPRQRRLYAINRLSGDVTVLDLTQNKPIGRVEVGRGASYAAIINGRLHVSRVYPVIESPRQPPANEITEIDLDRLAVVAKHSFAGIGAMFKFSSLPKSSIALVAALQPKNLLPTAKVARGGLFVNSIALLDRNRNRRASLPLDLFEDAFAQPFDIAVGEQSDHIYISGSGANEVAVLSRKITEASIARPDAQLLSDDLTFARQITVARIPVGRNPRGMALHEANHRLYVANRLDDTVSFIDTQTLRVVSSVFVGRTTHISPERQGEQHFHSAEFAHSRQFSCATCHIDRLSDGLSWDLEQDGFGQDIVVTKPLELLAQTAPYKWSGATPDLETECGPLSERYFFRAQGFRGEQLKHVAAFLKSIPTRPNRHRSDPSLSAAQQRGKVIFERKYTKDGKRMLPILECPACHPGPTFTHNARTSVGTRMPADRVGSFDTPSLVNVSLGLRFLHDGSAKTLKELWTIYNPKDLHGVTSDLTSSEIDDLVAYLGAL